VRIAHGKHLATAGDTRYHVSAIEMPHRSLQDVLCQHMLIDVFGNVLALQAKLLRLHKVALHLSVKAVSHQFQHDIAVAVDTRTLSLLGQMLKHLVYVGHVIVAAEA